MTGQSWTRTLHLTNAGRGGRRIETAQTDASGLVVDYPGLATRL